MTAASRVDLMPITWMAIFDLEAGKQRLFTRPSTYGLYNPLSNFSSLWTADLGSLYLDFLYKPD